MQYIIAISAGVKINKRAPRIKDFLPKYIRDNDDGSADLMAEVAAALTKQNG